MKVSLCEYNDVEEMGTDCSSKKEKKAKKKRIFTNYCTNSNDVYALGVPTMSGILTADSQKLSFSTLRKVSFLIL